METVLAPAKLTLSLRVTRRRADGYHLIDAEMVTVDLYDTLEITGIDGDAEGSDIAGPNDGENDGGDRAVTVAMVDPTGAVQGASGNNLVVRALALAGRRADVRVVKRIPIGAGLGGGSADAAAALRWAGFDDPLGAATIGADVAFCLRGGRARVGGIGELVEPLPFVEDTYTLLTPPFRCSTRAVYRAWDALGGPTGDHGNDLEPAALTVAPELARWRDDLAESTGSVPRLAGSGSTWFVPGSFRGPGRLVVRAVPAP